MFIAVHLEKLAKEEERRKKIKVKSCLDGVGSVQWCRLVSDQLKVKERGVCLFLAARTRHHAALL